MSKRRIFLTGASGGMGLATLRALLASEQPFEIVILALDTPTDRRTLAPFSQEPDVHIRYGDLTNHTDVSTCVKDADMVLHIGALVSPVADYDPPLAMRINYGSTVSIIRAIHEHGQAQHTRLVFIGTIAETGDRLPPIHWGRVGDPIKPSIFDYYAVSKVAAERAVIESGLRYWVSLRQTGILSEKMRDVHDAIMFHNCLDNVLEYVSDRDSARLMQRICEDSPETFWRRVYNIGGGASCRISAYDFYATMFSRLGITDLSHALDSRWFATRNFHGHYYLDSDQLETLFKFRQDSLAYFYDLYMQKVGRSAIVTRTMAKLPGGQRLIGKAVRKQLEPLLDTQHGTRRFFSENMDDRVSAYFVSREAWEKLPSLREWRRDHAWNDVVHIDHGYDERKAQLSLQEIKQAAEFRGGACLAEGEPADWSQQVPFRCAFGHTFSASLTLVLHAGHWCDVCERESWNYHALAEVSPFFAQVWYPLHDKNEPRRVFHKAVNELAGLTNSRGSTTTDAP